MRAWCRSSMRISNAQPVEPAMLRRGVQGSLWRRAGNEEPARRPGRRPRPERWSTVKANHPGVPERTGRDRACPGPCPHTCPSRGAAPGVRSAPMAPSHRRLVRPDRVLLPGLGTPQIWAAPSAFAIGAGQYASPSSTPHWGADSPSAPFGESAGWLQNCSDWEDPMLPAGGK